MNKSFKLSRSLRKKAHKASLLTLAAMLAISLTLPGCGTRNNNDQDNLEPPNDKTLNDPTLSVSRNYDDYTAKDESWAVYWYLCGTDLESGGSDPTRGGAGTTDLKEMLQIELPSHMKTVIQTGGAQNWKNDEISADELGRYVYEGSELRRIDTQPNASMGDPNTLASFLDFCNREYPAEHQVVILWDHGGGSLFGIESDELFDGDMITLPELRAVFNTMPAASGEYDIVGFDACLMATIDVADVLDEHARYLVASEETEPLTGWNYTEIFKYMSSLFEVPLTAEDLGRTICDSYFQTSKEYGLDADATLSMIDLSRFPALLEAYNNVGDEALVSAYQQTQDFYSEFERAAYMSESYGVISGKVSAFDMVDLGDLMRNSADLLEGDDEVLSALKDCVIYNVKGELRSKATGLACYFIYSGAQESLDIFSQIGTSRGFQYFYEYPLMGTLSSNGLDYINALSSSPVTPVQFPTDGLDQLAGHQLRRAGQTGDRNSVDWVLELGPDLVKNVSDINVLSHYALWDESENRIQASILLGSDTNYSGDWQGGTFQDGFSGNWYNLAGCLVSVTSDRGAVDLETGKGTWVLRVPIILNGERSVLEVHYTGQVDADILAALARSEVVQIGPDQISDKHYEVYGARPYTAPGEPPSKEIRKIVQGDVIQPLFEIFTYDYSTPEELDGDFAIQGFESITVGPDPLEFTREYLGDGRYYICFEMKDLSSTSHQSAIGWYAVQNGSVSWAEFD